MSLFQSLRRRQQHRQPHRQGPAVSRQLNVVCHCGTVHLLPVRMTLIAQSRTSDGRPMAVFACPYRGCQWREGWVIDFYTGRPRRLWARVHRGR